MVSFLQALREAKTKREQTLLIDKIADLKRLGIDTINLSLDTLDRERFFKITRRDDFPKVMECLEALLINDFNVKINMVVLAEQNVDDIIPMVELAKAKITRQ